ncbi:MAG: FAD-dependent oxidoreductase [Proteobacteria bacterium]|nr:FAD-dependent oxidoreductase [Pseudomonadota bacterium]MBU4581143.1 FAD-dependent oxidoreductase [Pseudomonadota bacterium]MCG2741449.1 FAD-dependent oxidoreductase [Syntrophaceae bacterium]
MDNNKTIRIVAIGANAAGLRAAARAKRLLPDAAVTVIDRGKFVSYGACGMPYLVSGDIEAADKLRETAYGVIRDPEFFRKAKGLEVVVQTEVERIDRDGRKIVCKSLLTGETKEYPYDKLILATGATPIVPSGIPRNSARVSTFRILEDAIVLRKALQSGQMEKVGLVGAGPIGCELAEAFTAMWGAKAILFDAAPTILPAMLDPEMARVVETYMKDEGVEIHTNCPLLGVVDSKEGVTIKTPEGNFAVDHVIIAIGVKPDSTLAAGCGLKIGKTGGIVVDERMTTSDPDIFAAGDCAELKHLVSGRPISLPLGSLANREGRVIGSNLGGGDERFGPVVGSGAVKVFDMNVSSTGLTTKAAQEAGFDVGAAWGSFTDRADYYPGFEDLHLKLLYDRKTTKLLGLQGYSKGEVVKRVDVFASLLKHGGKLEDLLDAEFAYAPPFAPAVDPLYSIACTARNELLEGVQSLPPDADLGDRFIVDVRRTKEASDRPLPEKETQNVPFEEFRVLCDQLPKDKDLVCICSKGVRSSEAARILKERGCTDVKYVGGGSLMKLDQKAR